MQARMRAVCLTGFGGFEKLEYREDVPVPSPSEGEVLVQVGACGVNNTDIWTREGAYGNSVDKQQESGWRGSDFRFPRIQGMDIVGHVVSVGKGVSESRVGERVIVNPTLYEGEGVEGLYSARYIGSEQDGGFAEFAVVPDRNAIPIQSNLADAELATFMVSYLTAEHMLVRGSVSAGQTVLVTGASGGVGSALLQLAKRRGAQVVAIVGRGKEHLAREIGADATINRGADIRTGLERVGLSKVHVILDVVGGPQSEALLTLLHPGGKFVIAGAIAGAKTQVDWRTVYLNHLDVLGSTMGTMEEARNLVKYIELGEIRPLLHKTYPLKQIVQAQKDFLDKKFFGKLAIVP